MLLIAIDTSGKLGGLSLAEGGPGAFRVIESSPIAGGTFSAQLVPTLAAVLQKHGYQPSDLGGFAAISGPGSFTGLRVGLSAIKALAEVLNKPIAAVSLLEALALSSRERGRIATALDAGRNEIYYGLYGVASGSSNPGQAGDGQHATMGHAMMSRATMLHATMLEEVLLSRAEFVEKLKGSQSDLLVTSDQAVAQIASSLGIAVREVARPGSESAVRIGLQKLLAGDTVSVEALDANYIRRSDAEIFFKAQR